MDEELIQSIRDDFLNGKPVIVVDEEREIEADFVYPAELMNRQITEFFVRYGKGLFCVVGPEENLLKRGFFRHLPITELIISSQLTGVLGQV